MGENVLPPMWAHQKEAVEKAKALRDMAVFFEMGTGKTRTLVQILREHYQKSDKILKTLIVGPSAVVPNWAREIVKYSSIPEKAIHPLYGSLKQRGEEYTANQGINIVNYEAFAFDNFVDYVLKDPPQILILDESHRVKSFKAKRTKHMIKLSYAMEARHADIHRYILTGSPVLNTEEDLFTQFLILDGGKTFGKNFFQFRAKYFHDHNHSMPRDRYYPDFRIKPQSQEEIKNLISGVTVQAKKEECLDLPPLTRTEIDVGMSSEQAKAYQSMKKDFIAFCEKHSGEKGASIARMALVKALRLQQILCGFMKLDDGTIHRFKENKRAEVLLDLLEDIVAQEKVIVWGTFHEDHAIIREVFKKLGVEFAEVTGQTTDKQAELDRFENDPKCRGMLSSQAAGGTGVNMIAASAMVYYSKGYNLEHDMQSEARNYRGGSERHKKITRYDLVARGTVDEIVLTALRMKKDLSTSILELRDLLVKI